MAAMRKPFQGVLNIIRFNWHFYVIAFSAVLLLLFAVFYTSNSYRIFLIVICIAIAATTLISLLVSLYVYDISGLYQFKWINDEDTVQRIVNISAGFDETSVLLKEKFKNAELVALDFYDPIKHTEVSIKRARKACPPYPGTMQVETGSLPLADNAADKIFMIMAAHEIRNEKERIDFFKELKRVLKPTGHIFIMEHLRDSPNFFAYNIGFFHFYTKSSWYSVFREAKFTVSN